MCSCSDTAAVCFFPSHNSPKWIYRLYRCLHLTKQFRVSPVDDSNFPSHVSVLASYPQEETLPRCTSERFLLNHIWNWQVLFTLMFLWRQFGSISTPNYKGQNTIGSTLCFQKGKIEFYKQLVFGSKFYKIQYYNFSKRSFSSILV